MANKIKGTQQENVVTSFANAGTAGGTFYYTTEGGIKKLWGQTASKSVVGSGFQTATYGLTLPVGFFTNVRSIQVTSTNHGNTQYVVGYVNAFSTSGVDIYWMQVNGGNGSCIMFVEVIGD